MKTKSAVKFLPFILLGLFFLVSNVKAQEIQVKGIVTAELDYESEPLQEVNVYLKNTSIGTTTNKKR